MEVFNLTISQNSRPFSPFTSKFLTTTSNKRGLRLYKVPFSEFHKKPSFPCYLLSSTTRRLQVSARFGGPTSRRNSLRKKLLRDQQVHQKNPIPLDVISNFVDNLNNDSVQEETGVNSDYADVTVCETSGDRDSNLKRIGESVLLNRLENWIEQYRKDVDYWGIGSGPIFEVFQDREGNVKRVLVNEDEIVKRSQVASDDNMKVNSRIVYAKSLAKEMESGGDVIPRNSSVAKFVAAREEAGFVSAVCGVVGHPGFVSKLSITGSAVLCGLAVCWVVMKLFSSKKEEVGYTQLEKVMLQRKIKSRQDKEILEKGRVEVVQEAWESPVVTFEKPKIDKQELVKNIKKVKSLNSKDDALLVDSLRSQRRESIDDRIEEIRETVWKSQETGGKEQLQVDKDELVECDPDDAGVIKKRTEGDFSNVSSGHGRSIKGASLKTLSVEADDLNSESSIKVEASSINGTRQAPSASNGLNIQHNSNDNSHDVIQSSGGHESDMMETSSIKMKPKVIRSVKEAREFLSRKQSNQEPYQSQGKTLQEIAPVSGQPREGKSNKSSSSVLHVDNKTIGAVKFGGASESISARHANGKSTSTEYDPTKKHFAEGFNGKHNNDSQNSAVALDHEAVGGREDTKSYVKTQNWMEKYFHEVQPIVDKIRTGFRDNFMVAREKKVTDLDITKLASEADGELDWMRDDKLREIVFNVRDNELAGRDPFYLIDDNDKLAFFEGLEKKVEKENEKLAQLHEYLHSNIENLDYGADGISLYDPPEKIIPRWKGPPLEKSPQVLDDYLKQRKALFTANAGALYPVKKDEDSFPPNSSELSKHEDTAATLATTNLQRNQGKDPKNSKTVIESSDGSVKSGKKSGKEFWQHTKKWSREFLESYNAETDPEIKSAMKDIGKDLDRWITEEEIQEAAVLMDNISERNKKFMEKKLNKIKREMELYGPQAVVSKYREYAEDKEEDYLWWLDLPHVLCIELYTVEESGQRTGFYSLEMAADLELEPKPYHVIAFEDASDCKNLCYIIQAHLDMLGSGHAFVIPRPPKDAYREAKANGFNVTVIKRGELQLSIDQTLEEVEEQITEIGSKMYHEMIMKERSVDIRSVMKGVLSGGSGSGSKPTTRKRIKKTLKRPSRNNEA